MKQFFAVTFGVLIAAAQTANGFTWPAPPAGSCKDLGKAICDYGHDVKTCLHVKEVKLTPEQQLWISKCRNERNGICTDELDGKPDAMDRYCKAVSEQLLKKTNGCMFGNCGEGQMAGICMAWQSGLCSKILSCYSPHPPAGNDHAFSICVGCGGQDILLDRWKLCENVISEGIKPPPGDTGGNYKCESKPPKDPYGGATAGSQIYFKDNDGDGKSDEVCAKQSNGGPDKCCSPDPNWFKNVICNEVTNSGFGPDVKPPGLR